MRIDTGTSAYPSTTFNPSTTSLCQYVQDLFHLWEFPFVNLFHLWGISIKTRETPYNDVSASGGLSIHHFYLQFIHLPFTDLFFHCEDCSIYTQTPMAKLLK